jgi:uncharacterized HAD superfamily protein
LKTKYNNIFVNPDLTDVSIRTPIAFDLDSVMNDGCSQAIRNMFVKKYDIRECDIQDIDPVGGYRRFRMELPPWLNVSGNQVYKDVTEAVLKESPSFLHTPYMPEVMRYVYETTGAPIAVVTARKPETVDVTARWLFEHLDGIPFHAYIINGLPKMVALDLLRVRIFVDDRFKTIKGLRNEIEYPVLYNRPWNMDRPVDLPVARVRDLRDIVPLLNIVAHRGIMDWPDTLPYPKPKERERT